MAESLPSPSPQGEMQADVRSRVVQMMLFGSVALGVARAFLAEARRSSSPAATFALILALVPLIGWWVLRRWHGGGLWLFWGGYLATSLLAIRWFETEATVCLLAVPTGLATLLLGATHGFVVAVAVSSLLVARGDLLGVSGTWQGMVALVTIWATQGID